MPALAAVIFREPPLMNKPAYCLAALAAFDEDLQAVYVKLCHQRCLVGNEQRLRDWHRLRRNRRRVLFLRDKRRSQ